MRLATYASVSVAVALIAVKFFAWITTDSVAILATLADSLLDAPASFITLFAVRHSLSPADREHRFGHGKAKTLAVLAQAASRFASYFCRLNPLQRRYSRQSGGYCGAPFEPMVR